MYEETRLRVTRQEIKQGKDENNVQGNDHGNRFKLLL